MLHVELPPRFYSGTVARVRSMNCLEVVLRLGFGVCAERHVVLEGVDSASLTDESRKQAFHALVVLTGGKNVIVQVNADDRKINNVISRVYLAEKVFGAPEGLVTPLGLTEPMLEIGTFFRWLGSQNYNVDLVKRVVNRCNNGAS